MDISVDSQIDFVINMDRENEPASARYDQAQGNGATVTRVTVVMADPSLVPPTFSGASSIDADAWFRRFLNYAEFRRLEGDDRLPLFRLLLVDAAADWVHGLPEETANSFDEVAELFHERFVSNVASKTANVAALWSRRQRDEEPAEDFINATKRLAAKIPIRDEVLVCHAAIQGLKDEIEVRDAARSTNPGRSNAGCKTGRSHSCASSSVSRQGAPPRAQ